MKDPFVVRLATVADASTIARHRAEMFKDMGELQEDHYDDLLVQSTRHLARDLRARRYVGWLAALQEAPETVVGGAGVLIYTVPPRPLRIQGTGFISRRQATVLNVFTEKSWRRRGIAERLMREILAWTETNGIKVLTLHSSDEGRALYERLGFKPTNEMRRGGP